MAISSAARRLPKVWKICVKLTGLRDISTSPLFLHLTLTTKRKLSFLEIDIDEGKQFFVRRIEFQGNTTTRDKVIRREIALEEGQQYNQQLWEFSILRLNQLGYFDQLKADDPNVTERHINEKDGTVDLTLKLKEKGKNSIGLSGGVSGLSGSFIGLNYSTNNFLGLGETLTVQVDLGTRQRDLLFGFTEPYMFERPIQFGFQVYTRKFNYNQVRETQILTGQQLNVSQAIQDNLQNYTQNSDGFSLSLSYPLKRSLKRVGLTYSFDRSSISALSDASKQLFTNLAFSGFSGPNSLEGISPAKYSPVIPTTPSTLPIRHAMEEAFSWALSWQDWVEPSAPSGLSCNTSVHSLCRKGVMHFCSISRDHLLPATGE